MTRSGKRIALWCVLIVGLVLCLTPSVCALWVTYRLVLKPAFLNDGRFTPPSQAEIRRLIMRDPLMVTSQFVVAPVGVVLVVSSLLLLRRLKQRVPPPLPPEYGAGRAR